jgi:hypothetical protein
MSYLAFTVKSFNPEPAARKQRTVAVGSGLNEEHWLRSDQ